MKNKDPLVCVLLAAYNGQNWIETQIDSILSQTGVCVNLFISIDLSSDKTFELCQKYQKNYKNVYLLPYGQSFTSASKNFFYLIKEVNFQKFDYLAFSDQDDIWKKNKLEVAVDCLLNQNCDAFSSDVLAFWSDGSKKLIKKSYPQKTYDYFFESSGPGCTFVLRVDAANKFKLFIMSNWDTVNQVSLHDWLLYAYIRNIGLKWHIDDNPLMLYRQHSDNVVGANYGILGALKRFKMLKNSWYKNEVFKIHQLVCAEEEFPFSSMYIIMNFMQLRRRPRDSFLLLLSALIGMMKFTNQNTTFDEN
jgi:rhamnosyltransferase